MTNSTRLPVPRNRSDNEWRRFARRLGFAVFLKGWGLKSTGVVRCDRIRTADIARRGGRFVERVPDALVQEVIARVQTIFGDALDPYASKFQ